MLMCTKLPDHDGGHYMNIGRHQGVRYTSCNVQNVRFTNCLLNSFIATAEKRKWVTVYSQVPNKHIPTGIKIPICKIFQIQQKYLGLPE